MVLGMDSRKNSNGFAKANGDPNKRKKERLKKSYIVYVELLIKTVRVKKD